MKLRLTEALAALFVGALFVFVAWGAAQYSSELDTLLGACGTWGMVVYVAIAFLATVVAPISATPLIPVASELWGPVAAGLLSMVGWTAGAVVAFWLSRRYGYSVVRKFVKLKKIQQYAERLPKKHLFYTVILLRLILPVDVLSYALGLFSIMPLGSYTLATIIGVAPFAFIFAFTATLPLWLQAVVLALVGALLFFSYKSLRSRL